MKDIRNIFAGMIILCGMGMMVGVGKAGAATNEVSGLLQQGLFEEEANHNLDAAIQAYQSVITRTQQDRQFEATAVFRLGECYRKLGRTNEANVQYQRILSEFADQTDLATLSRQNLSAMGIADSTVSPVPNAANAKEWELLTEQIKLVQQDLQRQENLVKVGVMPESDTVATREKLFELQRQMAALEAPTEVVPRQASAQILDPEGQKIAELQTVIRDSPDLINGSPGQTPPLFEAVDRNWPKVAQFLLDNKADLNLVWHGQTAINLAASDPNADLVRLFLDHGADANDAADGQTQGMTPLLYAARDGNKALAELLLAHHADVNRKQKGPPMFTPLHFAAQKGFLAIAELLLANGADVNARGDNGQTPLHVAATDDNPAIMESLIAHHAEVDAKDNNGITPLLAAAQYSSLRALRLLLTNGANVNAQAVSGSYGGRTPLYFAVENAKPEMAKLLLENHADPNLCRVGDKTPLMRAAEKSELDVVQMLLAHGADVNASMTGGLLDRWTPLYYAIDANAPEVVKVLLENKADPNAVVDNLRMPGPSYAPQNQTITVDSGATPLLYAVLRKQEDIARLLLAHKADPNLADTGKTTPLIEATRDGPTKLAELVLQSGADVNVQNNAHQSPLSLAVGGHFTDLLELILAHHPNLEVLDQSGYSPLQIAIHSEQPGTSGGDLEAARLLLDAGANPNAVNPRARFPYMEYYGPMAPLEGAVIRADRPMVELLLAHHADPNILDSQQGKTPLSWALEIQSDPHLVRSGPLANQTTMAEIVDLLRKSGANEHLQRLSTISVTRGWANATVIFQKGTNAFNHFTLFELLACEYSLPPGQGNGTHGLVFPDFGKIKISQVQPDGRTNLVNVSLDASFAAEQCADIVMQWGDLVEIPESDHKLNAYWGGLSQAVVDTLHKCVDRKVDIVVGGKTNTFTLRSRIPINGGIPAAPPSLSEFWLSQVVPNANVLLTSSDLSRVTVKRHDPASGKTIAMIFDLRPENERRSGNSTVGPPGGAGLTGEQQMILIGSPRDEMLRAGVPGVPPSPLQISQAGGSIPAQLEDLWLRDGDVIEIPEKP